MPTLRGRWMGTVAALTLVVSATTVGTAHAVACGTGGYYFDAAVSPVAYEIYGASAEIEYNPPILCGNTNIYDEFGSSISTAWAMVSDHRTDYAGSRAGWAQSGWIKAGEDSAHPGGTHEFLQYTNACKSYGGCGLGNKVETRILGSADNYSLYEALAESDNYLHMYIDNVDWFQSNYRPGFAAGNFPGWWVDWRTEFSGETHHPGTDMSGDLSNKTAFGSLASYDSSSSLQYNGNVLTHPATGVTAYKHEWYTDSGGRRGSKIWTQR